MAKAEGKPSLYLLTFLSLFNPHNSCKLVKGLKNNLDLKFDDIL